MEAIFDFLTGGVSGGIAGIIGGLGTAALKYFSDRSERKYKADEAKSKREHERLMLKAQSDADIAEINAGVQRDKIIMEGKADIEEMQALKGVLTNYEKDAVESDVLAWMMKNRSKWTAWLTVPVGVCLTALNATVDLLRKLVRPIITYGSVGFSFFVLWYSFEQLKFAGIAVDPDTWHDILMGQIKLISFVASTAVGFWFTDRSMSRKYQDSMLIK